MPDFRRSSLPHDVPFWIDPTQEAFFVTINCQPRGHNQLASADAWGAIMDSVVFREQRGDWKWKIILAMPDHLHGIVMFPNAFHPGKTISHWKRWMATTSKVHWQDGFLDHRLRTAESAVQKADYIRMNPVRAGLVESPCDWPYVRDWRNG